MPAGDCHGSHTDNNTGPTMEVDLQAIATWVLGHDTAEKRRAAATWLTDLLAAAVAPSHNEEAP